MRITITKYSNESIRLTVTYSRPIPGTNLKTAFWTTHVQIHLLSKLSSMYSLFVLLMCGPVTTSDKKNSKYMIRRRLLNSMFVPNYKKYGDKNAQF